MTSRPLSGIPLDRPLSVGDVGAILGVSRQRARRMLLRLERKHPGLVERNGGARSHYRVTLRALRRVLPRVGLEAEGDALANLKERVQSLETSLRRLSAALARRRAGT